MKERLDLALLEQGLASTRSKAQELIATGKVRVDGKIVKKSGEKVSRDSRIELLENEHPYVSRGGVKLAFALDHFGISPEGKVCLDVGISTGGFSHCLLMRGARKVYGVDVGTGQLSPRLKDDPRLVVYEQCHVKDLNLGLFAEKPQLLVVDLSFISLTKALAYLPPVIEKNTCSVFLVKPQFELGPEFLNSQGLVKDPVAARRALDRVCGECEKIGFRVRGFCESPISGGEGNREYLLHAEMTSPR